MVIAVHSAQQNKNKMLFISLTGFIHFIFVYITLLTLITQQNSISKPQVKKFVSVCIKYFAWLSSFLSLPQQHFDVN